MPQTLEAIKIVFGISQTAVDYHLEGFENVPWASVIEGGNCALESTFSLIERM